jgi:hypothetical protein
MPFPPEPPGHGGVPAPPSPPLPPPALKASPGQDLIMHFVGSLISTSDVPGGIPVVGTTNALFFSQSPGVQNILAP